MGYQCDFLDNMAYGTDDINGIRATFLTKGVIPDTQNSCKVVANGTGSIKILAGQAIFNDGSRIEITADHALPYNSTITQYVYFQINVASPEPIVSATAPTGSCIALAQISGGVIIDTRQLSALKIPLARTNLSQTETVNIGHFPLPANTLNTWVLAKEIDVQSLNYKYVYISDDNYGENYGYYHFFEIGATTGKCFGRLGSTWQMVSGTPVVFNGEGNPQRVDIKFQYIGTKLGIYLKKQSNQISEFNNGFGLLLL